MRAAVMFGVVAALGARAAADPLDKPAFTASPAELLAAAKARPRAPADADAVVLREETLIAIDDRGRFERRARVVFVIETKDGADERTEISLDWRPFYQDRPEIRARVVAPDGTVAALDPSRASDRPAFASGNASSDRRTLNAVLPHLVVGSVIEQTTVLRDREPLIGGSINIAFVGEDVPVLRRVVDISAPATRDIRVHARGFARLPTPQRATSAGRATWHYEFGRVDPLPPWEDDTPSDIVQRAQIGVAVARDWAAVAAAYRELVERRIAQAPVAPPAQLAGATARETIARTLAWLHAHVRGSGVELANGSIVPTPPAETLQRGVADAIDAATLLVAVLRAEHVDANLVLVDSGPGVDIDGELPSLAGFDRALVHVRADGADVWIDPSEPLFPAGVLPAHDRDRAALVIANGVRALSRTPAATPSDSAVREIRTHRAAELDMSTVLEESTETGVFWDHARSWLRDAARDEVTKRFADYVRDEYRGDLVRYHFDDPSGIASPASLAIEIAESRRVFTTRTHIDAYVFPTATLVRVPDALAAIDESPRRLDFAWSTPHTYVVENRIVVPTGHRMPQLVPHQERALGTMTLTTDRRIDGDAIVVTYRLDTGKLRLTPAEVATTRAAIAALREQGAEHIVIGRTAATLAREGHTKEAIAEVNRLIALHPKEALHYDQLASIYAGVGLGGAARRAARKGVDVQPKSADAHSMLAYHLRRDSFAREYGLDADRAAALAEYRKAIALDPNHAGALVDLASLLIVDARGVLAIDRAQLLEAVALWRRANPRDENSHELQIAFALFLAGQLAEVEKMPHDPSDPVERSAVVVAAIAADRGAPDAIAAAKRLADPGTALATAAGYLVLARRYELARAIYADAKRSATPLEAKLIANLQPIDLARLDRGDPKTATLELVGAIVGDASTNATWSKDVADGVSDARRGIQHVPQAVQFKTVPRAIALDLIAATITFTVEGSAAEGWSVVADVGTAKTHVFVVSERGIATIIGVDAHLDGVGRRILDLVAKRDVAAATRWVRRAAPAARVVEELVRREESAGTLSNDVLELAGAALLRDDAKRKLRIAEHCGATNRESRMICRALREDALRELGRWSDLAELERQRGDDAPPESMAIARRAYALMMAKKPAAAVEVLDAAIAKFPDDPTFIEGRATAAMAAGKWDEAHGWFERLAKHPKVGAHHLNNIAWAMLYADKDLDEARAIAARGEVAAGDKLSPQLAHTIAAIEAERDRVDEAWKYLQRSLTDRLDLQPEDTDWYVIGRIAEQCGLRDDAIAAYRRVAKPAPTTHSLWATYDLAQRRLRLLGTSRRK
jgi:tetratricopeptide (TPR) repeat protein